MSHAHGSASAPGKCPFPEAEVERLHLEDRHAGTAIVVLLLSIFLTGLALYLYVCYWVA